ncbi:hypothetical protein UlMin_011028 [Ulmus minor]
MGKSSSSSSAHGGRNCYRGHLRPAENEKLRELVEKYGPQNRNFIAEYLEGRSNRKSCRLRWYNQLDPNINKIKSHSQKKKSWFHTNKQTKKKKISIFHFIFPNRRNKKNCINLNNNLENQYQIQIRTNTYVKSKTCLTIQNLNNVYFREFSVLTVPHSINETLGFLHSISTQRHTTLGRTHDLHSDTQTSSNYWTTLLYSISSSYSRLYVYSFQPRALT